MKRIQPFLALLLTLFGFLPGVAESVVADDRRGIPGSIRRFERVARQNRDEAQGRTLSDRYIGFRALGRRFDLDLEPSDLTKRGIRNTEIRGGSEVQATPQITLLKGKLRGQPDSWVRLSIINGALDGIVASKGEMYFIQPASQFDADAPADESVVYRLSDAAVDLGPEACGVTHDAADVALDATALQGGGGGADVPLTEAATVVRETEMGLVADKSFYDRHPSDAAAQMLSVMNQISGIYEAQVGVSFRVTQTVVFSTPDPFSTSTVPGTLLDSFSAYRNNPTSPVFGTDLAHLFTGRDLDGGTVGIAWVGTVCSSLNGAGLSQDFSSNNTIRVVLTAHEIGHNFNARHDDSVGAPCIGPSSTPFIMQSFVSSSSLQQFSTNPSCSPVCCSQEVIETFAQGRSCLAQVNVGSPTPTGVPTHTRTPTRTPSLVPTLSRTPTRTPTVTLTRSPTRTATRTATFSPTRSFTATQTVPGPTSTHTQTRTATDTRTPTNTFTHTSTPTITPTPTITNTPGDAPLLPGLALWLDASQITGLSSGAAVSTWTDSSGNGHHATQGTASARPSFQASAINGRPAVRFDGTTDFLTNSNLTELSGQSGSTAFVVRKSNFTAGNYVAFSTAGQSVMAQTYAGRNYTYGGGGYGSASGASTAWSVWSSVFDGSQSSNATRLRAYSNGNSQSLSFVQTIPALLTIGNGYDVGRPFGLTFAVWSGDIAEVLVYSRTLSESERLEVEAYLQQKYFVVAPTATRTNTPPAVATSTPTLVFTATNTVPVNTATHTATRTNTVPGAFTSTPTIPPTSTATRTNTAIPPTATRTNTTTAPTATPVVSSAPGGVSESLVLWLDASKITGLASGAAVSTWADASGFGNDASQSSSTQRPVYRTSIINGKPVVRFDGVNDFLGNAAASELSGLSGATAFVVRRVNATSGNYVAFSSSGQSVMCQTFSNRTYGYGGGGYAYAPTASASFGVWSTVFDGTQSDNAGRLKMYLNGVAQNLSFVQAIPSTLTDGSGFEVGRPFGVSFAYWLGDIAEVVVYNRALTTAERNAVTQYLGSKYALAVQ